ncbi:SDR family oxidoreductase [Achromobacter sp. GG226]|uniref:SDR family oxidoreductase n=1 Tax=Verticiella alkaliphila TaxID=2779529 RepID=UPI001C0B6936|nr:SDR family oxidoreductase [Verticiella sp. GG226]MBU4609521.1 SDR family oxidoreductase [Verticiella sp. GG226]
MSDAPTPAVAGRLVFQPGLLAGRTALITGGNGGIGLGIAEVYGLLGASLVIVGRDLDKLAQAQVQLAETGARVITVVGDVREHDCAEQAVAQAVAVFGGLDILVNNAAGNFHSPFESMSPKGWRAVIDIDLNGTFNFCHAAFAPLRDSAHGGCIINISLSQAVSGWPGAAHAASAKAGVTTLTRSLAVEWGGHGIRVNNVLPGPIEGTEGVRRLYEARGQAEKELSRMALGRFGQVDDIAQACAYLASPAASFITGCDLTVDGGRALKRGWV